MTHHRTDHIVKTHSSNQTTLQNTTRKETTIMSRTIAGSILALGLAASTVTGSGATFAASQSATRPAAAQLSAAQARAHTQSALMRAVNSFGYAVTHGPDATINSYATPALLTKAPARHLINLLGPAQNPPQRYTFTIDTFRGTAATVTMRFPYNPSTTLTDRMTWVATATGWKVVSIQYLPDATGLRLLLYESSNGFSRAVVSGTDAQINGFATRDLLNRAPAGHLVNLFGLQNRPQSVSIQNVRLTGQSATATLVFRFGSQTQISRPSTWVYTDSGWRLAGVGIYGRG